MDPDPVYHHSQTKANMASYAWMSFVDCSSRRSIVANIVINTVVVVVGYYDNYYPAIYYISTYAC